MKTNSQVQLRMEDRRYLEGFRSHGQHSSREVTRAHILLALEAQVPPVQIQQVLGVSRMRIWRIQAAYSEKGLESALHDASRSGRPVKYSADQRAALVALASGQPPNGTARWTIRSLTRAAKHHPRLAGINRESVRRILKNASVDLHQSKSINIFDKTMGEAGVSVRQVA